MQHCSRTILSRQEYPEFGTRPVFILGGANGIGAALVEGFLSLGAEVGIIDRDGTGAEALAQSLASHEASSASPTFLPRVFAADLAVESERERVLDTAVRELGPPKTVVCTIGFDRRVDFGTVKQGELEELMRINGLAPILAARQLIAAMREGGGGSICLFTSRHGSKIFEPDMIGYGGGKAFLESGIQRLAQFAGSENTSENVIRVFGFCPGWVQTENQMRKFTNENFKAAQAEQLIPVDMHAEDIVRPVVFLCSSQAGLYTGQIFQYDAGEGRLSAFQNEAATTLQRCLSKT
jgi:NAD(P)-dependent dehydrogenase (short-subunit alcohol dehydrogenase family)